MREQDHLYTIVYRWSWREPLTNLKTTTTKLNRILDLIILVVLRVVLYNKLLKIVYGHGIEKLFLRAISLNFLFVSIRKEFMMLVNHNSDSTIV